MMQVGQHLGVGLVVVVARVAEDEHGRALREVLRVAIVKGRQRPSVVGVAIKGDDVGFGVDACDGVGRILDAFEEAA